ncbi:hypothetical protein O9992_22665 [Vibrio lentus]|nr:hypothetical protein [Vibrio lentus]
MDKTRPGGFTITQRRLVVEKRINFYRRFYFNPAAMATTSPGKSIKADFIYRHLKQFESQLLNSVSLCCTSKATDFYDQATQLINLCKQVDATCVYANSEPEVDEQSRQTNA